jgi:hypothetical protein
VRLSSETSSETRNRWHHYFLKCYLEVDIKCVEARKGKRKVNRVSTKPRGKDGKES